MEFSLNADLAVMGSCMNAKFTTAVACLVGAVIISLNVFLLQQTFSG